MHAKWALIARPASLQTYSSMIGHSAKDFSASVYDEEKQHSMLERMDWHTTCSIGGCFALGERANYKTNGSLAMGEVANEPFVFLWEEFQQRAGRLVVSFRLPIHQHIRLYMAPSSIQRERINHSAAHQ